jgi:predicted lactoylglutathione lyase
LPSIRAASSPRTRRVPLGRPSAGEFSVGHAVESRAEVDALLAPAVRAGATLTEAGHDRPWGIYAGYFHDLDRHLWEILWNPELKEAARGEQT